MFELEAVSDQLRLTGTEEDEVEQRRSWYFDCAVPVTCSGSTWNYTVPGQTVNITNIVVHEQEWGVDVNVTLAEGVLVYEDTAFAEAVSRLLGRQVDFTEQGQQDAGLVSLEV